MATKHRPPRFLRMLLSGPSNDLSQLATLRSRFFATLGPTNFKALVYTQTNPIKNFRDEDENDVLYSLLHTTQICSLRTPTPQIRPPRNFESREWISPSYNYFYHFRDCTTTCRVNPHVSTIADSTWTDEWRGENAISQARSRFGVATLYNCTVTSGRLLRRVVFARSKLRTPRVQRRGSATPRPRHIANH